MLILQQIFGYFLIGALLSLLIAVLYLPFGFFLRKKNPPTRQAVFCLLGMCVLVISSATFLEMILSRMLNGQPIFTDYHSLNLVPFRVFTESWSMGLKQQISQTVANVLMFIPFGFLLPIAVEKARRFRTAVLCFVGFSVAIEGIQYFIGRTSDIDDVLLNTIGGVLGYCLCLGATKLFAKAKIQRKLCGQAVISEKSNTKK